MTDRGRRLAQRLLTLRLAAGLLAACWCGAAFADGARHASAPIVLGYVEFAPFTYTDSGGRPTGSMIEMVARVAGHAGLDLVIRPAPPVRLFPGLAEGRFNLFMGLATPQEFQGTTLVGESVIGRIELDAYAMDQVPDVQRVEDLVGSTVIVVRGYSYAGWRPFLVDPANKVTLIEVESAEQGLALLRSRKAPLFLEYTLPMKLVLAGRTLPNLRSRPVSVADTHFVVSRATPDAASVLARLEASFQRLHDAGSLP